MAWTKLPLQQLTLSLTITFAVVSCISGPTLVEAQPAKLVDSTATSVNLPILRLGMLGQAVARLQTILKRRGFYRGPLTGYFDSRTHSAVIKAKRHYKLLPEDGVVDTATWRALKPPIFVLPNIGTPGQRQDAGTRDECPRLDRPLTALMPPTNIGLTSAEHPIFWFYIPYQPAPARFMELVLSDARGKEVSKTTFLLRGTPGIVSLPLAQTEPMLESGKRYQWKLSFICNPTNLYENPTVYGYVKRVPLSPALRSQLEKATTPWERIFLYGENGLWYETLTTLAEFRRTAPQNATLAVDWADLLRSVGLDKLALEPIVPCCTCK